MAGALVFDAYGTLFDVDSVGEACESLWPGKGTRLSQAWRAKQLEYTWQRSLMGRYAPFSQVTRDALEYACQCLALPLDESKIELLMRDYRKLALYPDVFKSLERLSGRRLAILTNGSPDMIGPLVAQSGLSFDAVISVDELRVYKPAPQVYQLAVDRLQIPKQEIVFVSSNCWDALGAKSFGFAVHWINRTDAPVDSLGLQPDRIVKGLDEILP